MNILNEKDYYRIVYGGWLGKNIGGTLGAPVEGVKELLNLTFYPELPDGPLENDDLDLQLVWLHALEQYGPGLTSRELGQEWLEHIFFPFDEYGYALTNLRRGLIPPVAGWFGNPFTNCMGSPIRSEIWAMSAPGAPAVAAYYAYQDAIVDHAGGEGVYGEMLFAAIESAIFFEKDRDRLIDIGMRYIPADCRTARAVNDLRKWHSEGKDWLEARSLVLAHHGDDNFTDAPQNIAFTLLGWLYGESFEDAILKATNCGYDTDCTAATLGAILGMLSGPEGLPARWVDPVGERVVVSPPIKGFPAPKHLDELTRRTMVVGKRALAYWDTGIVIHDELATQWTGAGQAATEVPEAVRALWSAPVTANTYLLPQGTQRGEAGLALTIAYGADGPAIGRGQAKTLRFVLANRSGLEIVGELALELPAGFAGPEALSVRIPAGGRAEWEATVRASDAEAAFHALAVTFKRIHDGHGWATERVPFALVGAAEWTLWTPGAAEGVKAYVPTNRIAWEQAGGDGPGVYRASTTLRCPSARELRLIAAANAPVTLRLNGEAVIACAETPEFMPAYHRAPESQRVHLTLPAGDHVLEVEAVRGEGPLDVYVLPVATNDVADPGRNYYYTDLLFLQ